MSDKRRIMRILYLDHMRVVVGVKMVVMKWTESIGSTYLNKHDASQETNEIRQIVDVFHHIYAQTRNK